MPSLKDLKSQLNAISKTQSITKAMYNLANSKVASAQKLYINQNIFNGVLEDIISDMYIAFNKSLIFNDEFSYKKPIKNLYILITSDRGLVGGYHQKLFKYLDGIIEKDEDFEVLTIGKKGHYNILKKKYPLFNKEVLINRDNVFINPVGFLSKQIIKNYLNDEYKGVYVVYNEFVSSVEFNCTIQQIFPISIEQSIIEQKIKGYAPYFVIEDNKEELVNKMLPIYVTTKLLTVLCAAKASEHAARKNAMKNASDNAADIIKKLRTKYNRLRQESITTELIDIINGSNV